MPKPPTRQTPKYSTVYRVGTELGEVNRYGVYVLSPSSHPMCRAMNNDTAKWIAKALTIYHSERNDAAKVRALNTSRSKGKP